MIKSLRFQLLLFITLLSQFAKAQTDPVQHIRDLQATVEARRAYVSEITQGGTYALPIGLLKQGDGGEKPAILIDRIELFSDHAVIDAYAAFNLPGSDNPLYFQAKNVSISYTGGVQSGSLALVKDREIKLFNDDTKFTILGEASKPGNGSAVYFDCKGFTGAKLNVEAALSSKIVKENTDGSLNTAERVKAEFELKFSSLNDIIASATIKSPFQISGIEGLSFDVSTAVLDLSDYNNHASMSFPAGYKEKYYPGGTEALWRGFYLEKLSVRLPKEFENRNASNSRTSVSIDQFSINKFIIDNHGVSGKLSADNVLPDVEDGNLAGWSYSINNIQLEFVANKFTGGSLAGKLKIPVSSTQAQPLTYTATVSNDLKDYVFDVKSTENIDFSIFKAAQVSLSSAAINIAVLSTDAGRKFKADATLSGSMTVGASIGDDDANPVESKKFSFANIGFTDLKLSTSAPYISAGTFSFSGMVKVGAFSASILHMELVKEGDDYNRSLKIDMSMNVVNAGDATNDFALDATLRIKSKLSIEANGRKKYSYEGTALDRLKVDVNQGSFELHGYVDFFTNNPSFGNGFSGALNVSLPAQIKVAATAIFGSVGTSSGSLHRYWYVDALTTIPGGVVQVVPGLIEINGFAGGLYYGMKQAGTGTPGGIGTTATGLAYVPDEQSGLGVKASVMFGLISNPASFNGNIGFEVSFNKNTGGLKSVKLMGNAYLMQGFPTNVLDKVKANCSSVANAGVDESKFESLPIGSGAFSVNVMMTYTNGDEATRSLHIDVRSKLNALGVSSIVIGTAHFQKNLWYINIGEMDYSKRVKISLFDALDVDAYFMIGSNIPSELPALPWVSNAAAGKRRDDSNGDIIKGKGFAFGASISADLPKTKILFIYGEAHIGAGFDIILANYGNVTCAGKSGTIGINGWYAKGQIYAFVEASFGLEAKIFKKVRRFELAGVNVYASFQAELPNPFWMKAKVNGNIHVMGGLIKGKFDFEFERGEKCKMVSNGPTELASDIKVISEIIPKPNEEEVSVFNNQQVLFNIGIGKEFIMKDVDGVDVVFKSKEPVFQVKYNSGGLVDGQGSWNADKTVWSFKPTSVLQERSLITVTASLTFEEKKGGSWIPFYADGKLYEETMTSTFKSGARPWSINGNVSASYPYDYQINFYKQEYQDYESTQIPGYILLDKQQEYLFTDPYLKQVAVLKTEGGAIVSKTDVSYDNASKLVSFKFADVNNQQRYKLVFQSETKADKAAVDENVIDQEAVIYTNTTEGVEATETKKDALVNKDEAKQDPVIYQLQFRVSKYNTFESKLNSAVKTTQFIHEYESKLSVDTDEPFEERELPEYGQGLISITTDIESFKSSYHPNVYENYPVSSDFTLPGRSSDNYDLTLGYYNYGSGFTVTCDPKIYQHDFDALVPQYKLFYYQNAGVNPVWYLNFQRSNTTSIYGVSNDYPNGLPYYGFDDSDNGKRLDYPTLWAVNCDYEQNTLYWYYSYRRDCRPSNDYDYNSYYDYYYRHMLFDRKQRGDMYDPWDYNNYPGVEPDAQTATKLERMKSMVEQSFQSIYGASPIPFSVVVSYVLPGINQVTNSININVNSNY